MRSSETLARAAHTAPAPDMNKTEAAYAAVLDEHKAAGRIVDWRREPISLRLADRPGGRKLSSPWYKPDFVVLHVDRTLEMVEVKGWTGTRAAAGSGSSQAARLRIKIAAATYPWFRFVLVSPLRQKDGGGWHTERISR